MICDKYNALSHREKTEMVGLIVHAIQSDEHLFTIGEEIIRMAKMKGLFDDVKILPDQNEIHDTDTH